jgi:dTMP kinase
VGDTPVNGGRLVAFEGIDGCGKSTQLRRFAENARKAGRDVVVTGEPTTGPTGRRIREMARSGTALAPTEELRWFVEDRRVHVREVIEPALAAGRWVVTDRYFLSTVAYQGARGLDFEQILADSESEFPVPDLVVLLEIDTSVALERIRSRGGVIEEVFERKEFLGAVAEVFGAIDRPYLERIAADSAPDALEVEIFERVLARFGSTDG